MVAAIAKFFGIDQLFVKLGIGLLTLLAIGFAVWRIIAWYDGQIDAAFARGETAAYAKVEKRVFEISEKLTVSANELRDKANAENRITSAAADSIRLQGPGRASCPAVTVAPASGFDDTITEPGDAVARLPYPERVDLIGLPFAGTVDVFEQHDKLLTEVKAWRENYRKQSEIITAEQK